jgi:transcriptional regulator with GAF, ATPase, and Fis domain
VNLEDITELVTLRQHVPPGTAPGGIVGRHPKMVEVYGAIRDVAPANVSVLILGESGTGKELVARAIHDASARGQAPFVAVNCGALPEGLLESELFGHVRGAFTGAIRDKKGRFELADRGTIFLDEVGDLTPLVQVKLLRVLQEGTIERVGSESTLRVDVRVISATNRNLREEVDAGRFRGDLYYRLCVVPITLPPLRQRREDIPLLAGQFLQRIGEEGGVDEIGDDAMAALMSHPWPGNVRELQNALQYAVIKARGGVIGAEHLPVSVTAGAATAVQSAQRRGGLTRPAVEAALRETGGNRLRAARRLGVSRATLYRFLARAGAVSSSALSLLSLLSQTT